MVQGYTDRFEELKTTFRNQSFHLERALYLLLSTLINDAISFPRPVPFSQERGLSRVDPRHIIHVADSFYRDATANRLDWCQRSTVLWLHEVRQNSFGSKSKQFVLFLDAF